MGYSIRYPNLGFVTKRNETLPDGVPSVLFTSIVRRRLWSNEYMPGPGGRGRCEDTGGLGAGCPRGREELPELL